MSFKDTFKDFVFKNFDAKVIVSSEPLVVVLKAHLIFESLLDKLLEQYIPDQEFYKDLNLKFYKKLELIRKNKIIDSKLYKIVKRLNEIRNDFVHKLDLNFEDVNIDLFTDLVSEDTKSDPRWSMIDKKEKFGICIHYFLGYSTQFVKE